MMDLCLYLAALGNSSNRFAGSFLELKRLDSISSSTIIIGYRSTKIYSSKPLEYLNDISGLENLQLLEEFLFHLVSGVRLRQAYCFVPSIHWQPYLTKHINGEVTFIKFNSVLELRITHIHESGKLVSVAS